MSSPTSRAMRAALASGRVRTLSTAKALLKRGWIVSLPQQTSVEHTRETGEAWTALDWTDEGVAARASIRPLPATPPAVVSLLRGDSAS